MKGKRKAAQLGGNQKAIAVRNGFTGSRRTGHIGYYFGFALSAQKNDVAYWDWNPPWVDIKKYVVDVIGKFICFDEERMDEREDFNERIDALKRLRVA